MVNPLISDSVKELKASHSVSKPDEKEPRRRRPRGTVLRNFPFGDAVWTFNDGSTATLSQEVVSLLQLDVARSNSTIAHLQPPQTGAETSPSLRFRKLTALVLGRIRFNLSSNASVAHRT
jgi:hypothetical protein